jgi:hypothetical protein
VKGYTEIELDDATVRLGLAMGLMKIAADGVVELTPKESKWLRDYCDNEIAIARMWAW